MERNEQRKYVPILRAKQGEFSALGQLAPSAVAAIMPLIEVQTVSDPGSKSLEEHLANVAGELEKRWSGGTLMVDDQESGDVPLASGEHPLEHLFGEFAQRSVPAVPVTGLRRTPEYQAAVAAVVKGTVELCVRLHPEDVEDVPALSRDIDALLEGIHAAPGAVHLLLDFGSMSPSQVNVTALAVQGLISALPHLHDWRTLTLAVTSFPVRLSDHVGTHSVERLPRASWNLWKRVAEAALSRTPSFGDYAVDNPDVSFDIDPRILGSRMTAAIRYSTEDHWLIVRGGRLQGTGYGQYYDLSATLMREPEYNGRDYSAGDEFIHQCAVERKSPGNQTTWRFVAVNHHITLAAEQLASHPAT